MRHAVLILMVAALVAACGGQVADPPPAAEPDSEAPPMLDPEPMDLQAVAALLDPAEAAVAADAVSSFGLDLLRIVAGDRPGANAVLSPMSAAVLLAMVADGSRGATAEAMAEALRLDDVDARTLEQYAALMALLELAGDVDLRVANAGWARPDVPFEPGYVERAARIFGAPAEQADLGDPSIVQRVDEWVAEHTDGLITELAEALGLPDRDIVLVLVNAVYFKGTWATEFDPDRTADLPFTLPGGDHVPVATMHAPDLAVGLARRYGYVAARLPYGEDDGRFGFEVFLPDEGRTVEDLLVRLDAAEWREAIAALHRTSLPVWLPRFELRDEHDLVGPLTSLGMGVAFTRDADFSGMSPLDELWIDAVVQKTYIRVDEEGTEAAAVTGGTMRTTALAPEPELRVDRPFVFTLSDRDTGAILFAGVVSDPRG